MSSPNQAATNAPPPPPPPPTFKNRLLNLFNFEYFKTLHFILKVILILFHIAGAIAVGIKYENWGSTRYYHFVAITGIILILIIILLHFVKITQKIEKIPWNFIELIFAGLWAVLILIAAAIVTDSARKYAFMDSYAAAAFFGYAAFIVYVVDAFIRVFKLVRGRKLPQPTTST